MKLRALLSQTLLESVQAGWIDLNTYAYSAFVHSDPLSVREVFEFLIDRVSEFGVLTTTDIAVAVELGRQVKIQAKAPKVKRGLFGWLAG